MKFSIFLLFSFATLATAQKKIEEKCPYRSTVDLTNQAVNENGSYVYQGVLIPREKQTYYDYHLLFRNRSVPVPVHLRGCVCNEPKPCIKLCCAKNEIFNTYTYKCEKISKDLKIKWDLPIRLLNGTQKIINVFQKFIHQVGTPCEKPEPYIRDIDEWVLLESGEIYFELEDVYLDTVNYCFTPYKSNISEEHFLMPYSCPNKYHVTWTQTLNTYSTAVLLLFLIPTIVVYMIFEELRGNLRGKILICYLLSLLMAYSIVIFISISRIQFDYITCSLLGYTCYFFFRARSLFLCVLCYEIWHFFKENNIEINARENNKRFIYYSLHAWGWSLIFTLLIIWADLSPTIPKTFKPRVGIDTCWVNTLEWSAAIYIYCPNLVIHLFNFITFIYITIRIYKIRQDTGIITYKERYFRKNASVILRLFLIMGVTWIFHIVDSLSYGLRGVEKWQGLFVISDLIAAVQGLLIFALFVLKRNVLSLLKKRFITDKHVRPKRSTLSLTTNTTKLKASSSIETSL